MSFSMATTSGKILASVALVGTAAAVAGIGTYGGFTSSTDASQEVTAGTVVIALGTDAEANTLAVPVAGFLPGDSVEKFATLSNTGDSDFSAVTLTTTAGTTASLLTTDPNYGLRITIESCTVAWTTVVGAPDTCTGDTQSTLLSDSAIIVANQALGTPTSLTAGQSDFLKVTTSLHADADDTFQGETSTVTFTFDATQRAAEAK